MQFYSFMRLTIHGVLAFQLFFIAVLLKPIFAQPTSVEQKTDEQKYDEIMTRIRSRIPQLEAWDARYASFYKLALAYLERTHGSLSDEEAALLDDLAILPTTDRLATPAILKDLYRSEITKLAMDKDSDVRKVRYALTFLHMMTSWKTGVLAELSTDERIQLLELRRQAGAKLSDVYLGFGKGAQFHESDLYDWYVNYFLQTIAGASDAQELVKIITLDAPRNVLWEEGHRDAVRRALSFVDRFRLSNSETRSIEGLLKGLSPNEQRAILRPRLERLAHLDLALSQSLESLALRPPLLAVSNIDSFYFAFHLARDIQASDSPETVIEYYYEALASLDHLVSFAKDELTKSGGLSPSGAMDRIDVSLGPNEEINPDFVSESLTHIKQSLGRLVLDHLMAYREILARMNLKPAKMRTFLNLVATVADFADSDLPAPFVGLIEDHLSRLISESAHADEVLMALKFDSMEINPKEDPSDVELNSSLRRIKQKFLLSRLREFGRLSTQEMVEGKLVMKSHLSYRNLAELLFAFVPEEKLAESVAQAKAVDRERQYSDLGRFVILVLDLEKLLGSDFAPALYGIAETLRRVLWEERIGSGLQKEITGDDRLALALFKSRLIRLGGGWRTLKGFEISMRVFEDVQVQRRKRLASERNSAENKNAENKAVQNFFRSCL